MARRAGTKLPASAVSIRSAAIDMNVAGSVGVTPKSSADISRVAARAPAAPIRMPPAASAKASLSTMAWLPSLQKKYGSRATVIAIAVDSKLEDVRKVAASFKPNYPIVMGTPEVIQAFGAVAAVPKLIVYDGRGRRSQVLYGAPSDLHDQIETALQRAAESR